MIRVEMLTKRFNTGAKNAFCALNAISFHIHKGEMVLLKGASGSGKSTLLSLIAALSKPTSGEIIVEDKRLSKLPDHFAALFRREKIGIIFQQFNLISSLSVYDNIIVPLIPLNLSEKEMKAKAQHLLNRFGMNDKTHTLVKNLSGGEQQRVVICRALINDPSIILADEPTANLDATLSLEFVHMMQQLKAEGKTIVIATHDSLFFDLACIDRCIALEKGHIV